MRTKTSTTRPKMAVTFTIRDVHQDFMISREAIGVSPQTYKWYDKYLGRYYKWLENKGFMSITDAANVRNIYGFLADLRNSKPANNRKADPKDLPTLSDRYIHCYARVIKTLLRFAHEEHYIEELVTFKMPPIRKNKLPVLEVDDIHRLLTATQSSRDYTLITLAIASGMRLSEIVALNWRDVDLRTGRIDVLEGKGKKYRTVIIDKQTLRTLIQYHNELQAVDPELVYPTAPVFHTADKERFTSMGLRSIFVRLSGKTGIRFSAHALRRTFAKLAVKNGMDIVWLQHLMGHANLETTRDYVQGLDIEDVDKAYQEHAPLKGIVRRRK